jgi:hypothetical protein
LEQVHKHKKAMEHNTLPYILRLHNGGEAHGRAAGLEALKHNSDFY